MNNIYWLLELEIRPGQLSNFQSLMQEMVSYVQHNEPATLNYEWHTNAEETICHIYERYEDSAAVMAHLAGFQQFASRFGEVLAPLRFTVFGSPSEDLKAALAALNPTYMRPAVGVTR